MADIPISFSKREFKDIRILINDYITLARMIIPVRNYIDSELLNKLVIIEYDLKLFTKTQQLTFPSRAFIRSEKYFHPPGLSIHVILAVLNAHTIKLENNIRDYTIYLSTSRFPYQYFRSLM